MALESIKTYRNIYAMRAVEKTIMSVQELSAQMGISLLKAYELVKEPESLTINVGARILNTA